MPQSHKTVFVTKVISPDPVLLQDCKVERVKGGSVDALMTAYITNLKHVTLCNNNKAAARNYVEKEKARLELEAANQPIVNGYGGNKNK